jgi:hypothetical protein
MIRLHEKLPPSARLLLQVHDSLLVEARKEDKKKIIKLMKEAMEQKVKIGKREIILQHTTPRNMATAGRKSGTFIQALRHLGRDQVDDQVLATLRRQITDEDRPAIRKDLRHAPAWIADLLRPLTEPKASA